MNPGLANGPIAWIVQRAATMAPEAIRHRLEEEWRADLSAFDVTLLRLRFALGCCLAALAMRGDSFNATVPKTRPNIVGVRVEPRQGRSRTTNAAAALMATCMAALPLLYAHYSVPGLILGPALEGTFMEAQGTVYTSGRHTLRRVALADGTRVVMNRGTRIAVLYSDHNRSVLLVRGEATFTVPRQARRSFDLTVGGRRFGSEASTFNVRLTGTDAIELTVLEGTVTAPAAFAAAENSAALHEGDMRFADPTLLKARQLIDTEPSSPSARTLSQLEAQNRIAWQRG